jgi:hypothetical protein
MGVLLICVVNLCCKLVLILLLIFFNNDAVGAYNLSFFVRLKTLVAEAFLINALIPVCEAYRHDGAEQKKGG